MTNASSSHVSLLHVLSAHMLARVFESARGARRGVLEGLAACLMLLGVAARRQVHGLGRWQYTDSADAGRRRDLRLDLLRGFAVFAMIVDHIGGESSWLYAVTGGDRFFVSAAELFVVVSGLTMGLVYSKVYVRGGTRAILAKAAQRTYLLYVLTVSLTLATALVAVVLELPWAPPTSGHAAAEFVWGVLSLQRAYYLTDVLLLYTLLVLFAGPVLAVMVRGYTWLVLAASWGVWVLYQTSPAHAQLPWPVLDNTAFPFAAWQVYFFTALAVGFHRPRLARLQQHVSPGLALLGSAALAGGLVVLHQWTSRSLTAGADAGIGWLIADLFYKYDVRIGRLLAVPVVGILAYYVLTLAWAPLRRGLGWLLVPLGERALTAYVLHLFLVPLLASALFSVGFDGQRSAAENAAIQAAGVLAIWSVLKLRQPAMSAARRAAAQLAACAIQRAQAGTDLTTRRVGGLGSAEPMTSRAALTVRRASGAALLFVALFAAALSASRMQLTSTTVGDMAEQPGVAEPAAEILLPIVGFIEPSEPEAVSAVDTKLTPTESRTHESSTARIERNLMWSAALGREMPLTVYLPGEYDRLATARFPVLYMLHGMGGQNTEWEQYGLLETADRLIASGQIEPLIIVLPQGDQSYWVDWADGGPAWGLYAARDVVQHVDTSYRTIADPAHRAVGGLSMGAHGALQLALAYPGLFGVVGAHSPSLRSFDERLPYFGDQPHFSAHDPLQLVQQYPERVRGLQLWLDVGEQDVWHASVVSLHAALEHAGAHHLWRVYPGEHDAQYWTTHIPEYLRFYSRALQSGAGEELSRKGN